MKNILALLALCAAVPAFAAESAVATVNGMVCAFCAQGIEKRLGKLPSTKAVFVDLKNKIVVVEAKDGHRPDGKAITAEITDAGYDVTKLTVVAKGLEEIKAERQGAKK